MAPCVFGCGRVEGDGGANERLQGFLVNLVAFAKVDRAPDIAVQTGIEKARWVFQRRAFGEGHLHDALVRFPGREDAVMFPHRNATPFPRLDHVGIGLFDDLTNARKHFAPPVAQFFDPRIDQLRGVALRFLCAALFHR